VTRTVEIVPLRRGWVRGSIFEYKSYWDYDIVKKLEELETALATLETSEKKKPQHDSASFYASSNSRIVHTCSVNPDSIAGVQRIEL
jgi:hypothetical protein